MAARLLSSVRSASRLLCTFTATDRELGVSELARRLGLSKGAVHRLLTTLAADGLIERNPRTGRYRLGIRMYELGTVVSSHYELHEAVAMYIDDLRLKTGETVQVGILDGHEVVYIERRESRRTLRNMVRLGHRNAAHITSCGKVLLAFLPEVELERILAGWSLDACTPHSITDPARLRAELRLVRDRGYAENVAEASTEMASVAAPVHDDDGIVVAAMSVAAPITRMGVGARRRYAGAVLDTTARISEQLGYRRPRRTA